MIISWNTEKNSVILCKRPPGSQEGKNPQYAIVFRLQPGGAEEWMEIVIEVLLEKRGGVMQIADLEEVEAIAAFGQREEYNKKHASPCNAIVLNTWIGNRRGRQPIDIRLSVMAVTRRGLPIESITGAEALVESCGDGEPQKKKRATEQSISSSRGETLGSPVYER
ncbi:UNVERIFIED_CONTAM: hypothetical protein FKN15_005003 [Acipenser sinensis]